MTSDVRIAKVVVEGLHGQFDIELDLNPGLNIIYGKNGRGKTTILHLLANALELDFRRFAHLTFQRIEITTNKKAIVEISKDDGSPNVSITINGAQTGFSRETQSLTPAENDALRTALGGRPTYLPAFRSVLERARTDNTIYRNDRRDNEIESIIERETAALVESANATLQGNSLVGLPYDTRTIREESHAVAQKTSLCRQWFGDFVPVIRYPSVADVDDALTEEYRRAQYEINQREQKMLEESFLKIFKAISGSEKVDSPANSGGILESISKLVGDQDSSIGGSESQNIYRQLQAAARSVADTGESNNAVLEIYRQMLETRSKERKIAFQRSRDFEASINKFLDSKKLAIGFSPSSHLVRMRSAVWVRSGETQAYSLSALSSGERQILTMLYSASRTRFLSGMFLIDEPELSLHIDWQRMILRELQNQSADRQIIACTHSPEVGADHLAETQEFEPRRSSSRQQGLFGEEEI